MPSVAFYISGHGFGHASREIEIINALGRRLPAGWRILVRTAAARWLFDRTLTTPVIFLDDACDTGVIQIDSVRLDEEGTARAAAEFYRTFDGRIAAETTILLDHDVRLVVSDAPPLACAAAAQAGVPAKLVGKTGGSRIVVRVDGRDVLDVASGEAERTWSTSIARHFRGRAA